MQADIVLLSLVRSNAESRLGFMSGRTKYGRNRMNVALSRAREALIIIGDKRTVQRAPGLTEILRDGRDGIGAPCWYTAAYQALPLVATAQAVVPCYSEGFDDDFM